MKIELWSVCFPDCFSRSNAHIFFFFPPRLINNSVDLGRFISAARFGKFKWGKFIWASKNKNLGLENKCVDLDLDRFLLKSDPTSSIWDCDWSLMHMYKSKLQITTISFYSVWNLYLEVSEFRFYPMKFGSI